MAEVRQLIQRTDTAASWNSANTVLAAGEIGVEGDTGRFKVGNGSTAWNSLPYASVPTLSGTGKTAPKAITWITSAQYAVESLDPDILYLVRN